MMCSIREQRWYETGVEDCYSYCDQTVETAPHIVTTRRLQLELSSLWKPQVSHQWRS